MATASPRTVPRAVPKSAPTAAPPPEPAPETPRKSRKKRYLVLLALVLVLGGGAAGAWWYWMSSPPTAAVREAVKPPVFAVLEPFTVNLAAGENGDQYLQVALTLQVANQAQVDRIKLYMPQVRSRILLLLTSKKASQISTVEGKKKLSTDIIAQINLPFTPNSEPQTVSGVFFTSFVIQ